jgi:hypothetical protein
VLRNVRYYGNWQLLRETAIEQIPVEAMTTDDIFPSLLVA